jgi:hypothetical protein
MEGAAGATSEVVPVRAGPGTGSAPRADAPSPDFGRSVDPKSIVDARRDGASGAAFDIVDSIRSEVGIAEAPRDLAGAGEIGAAVGAPAGSGRGADESRLVGLVSARREEFFRACRWVFADLCRLGGGAATVPFELAARAARSDAEFAALPLAAESSLGAASSLAVKLSRCAGSSTPIQARQKAPHGLPLR